MLLKVGYILLMAYLLGWYILSGLMVFMNSMSVESNTALASTDTNKIEVDYINENGVIYGKDGSLYEVDLYVRTMVGSGVYVASQEGIEGNYLISPLTIKESISIGLSFVIINCIIYLLIIVSNVWLSSNYKGINLSKEGLISVRVKLFILVTLEEVFLSVIMYVYLKILSYVLNSGILFMLVVVICLAKFLGYLLLDKKLHKI